MPIPKAQFRLLNLLMQTNTLNAELAAFNSVYDFTKTAARGAQYYNWNAESYAKFERDAHLFL